MPSLVQHAVAFGAKRMALRSRARFNAPTVDAQARTFVQLTDILSTTQYGLLNGVRRRMSYEAFRRDVPLCTYESLVPYIEDMKRGASDVLWRGKCSYYAVSSGTTSGRTKYLPITDAMIAHFRATGLESLLTFTRRVGSTDIFRGKHLFLGGSTTLSPLKESEPFVAFAGDLSGITAMNMPAWVERSLYEPGRSVAQISDWPAKIRTIAQRTWNRDIRVVAGIPSWLLILAEEVLHEARRHGVAASDLQSVWPNLQCLIHGGVPIAPYIEELRRAFGASVTCHEVYPASEGFIAVQDADPEDGLRLLSNSGIFFEFIPLAQYDESNLGSMGALAVGADRIQPGVDYVLVLTTPAGLCRYILGDVVRFISTLPPRLLYVGRTKLQLSAFGEHVIEKELTDALAAACRDHRCRVSNFHVAPVFVKSTEGQKRGQHEWWIELSHGEITKPVHFAASLDAELKKLNDDYEAKRLGGGLALPAIRVVPAGVFKAWMQQCGKWGGQNKLPRCRSDRTIADALATLVEDGERLGRSR